MRDRDARSTNGEPPAPSCGFDGAVLDDYSACKLAPEAVGAVEAHLRDCGSCASTVAMTRALRVELRALPMTTRGDRVWRAIESAVERERAARPPPFLVQSGALLAAALLVAATMLLRNEAASAAIEGSWLAALARVAPLHRGEPLVLPTLFLGFGAFVSLLALPLLRARRVALPALLVAASAGSSPDRLAGA
jgi:anti-sigma factor RsiW